MARQKMISTSKLGEIIDLMKNKGVQKITIPETVSIEIFAFSVSANALPEMPSIESSNNSDNNEKSDMDLLLHSAG